MASRISHILTSPFRKKHSGSSLVGDFDYDRPDEDAAIIASSNHSSKQELAAENEIRANNDQTSEWTLCSCCLQELHEHINCVPTTPKHRVCANCHGCLCKSCKVRGICHECIIRHEVKLAPETLMELDENKLRDYVHMLHYPSDGFQNCPKPFLVKQILVRYHLYENWDPKKLVAPVTQLVAYSVPSLADLSMSNENFCYTNKVMPIDDVEGSHANGPGPSKKAISTEHRDSKRLTVTARVGHLLASPFKDRTSKSKSAIENDHPLTPEEIEVCQAEVERAVILRQERRQLEQEVHQRNEDADYQKRRKRTTDFSDTSSQKHFKHHENLEIVKMADINSLDDIKMLKKIQLKYILWLENVDYDLFKGKKAYYEAVVALWLSYGQHEAVHVENDPAKGDRSSSMKPHKQLHRLQYNSPSQDQPSTSKSGKSIVKLRDLPASSFAEQMSDEQLREILVYHNFEPDEYPERGDLVYAVLCLWHAIRRGHTTKKIVQELNSRPKSLKLNVDHKEVAIESLKSPSDIHHLDPVQLRDILIKHGVDPDKYKDDDELYLGVVNLWSGLVQPPKPKPKLEEKTSDNRTVAETAIAVSKWLKQGDKPNAPLALADDITFIDDEENSDYEAIGGHVSSSSSSSSNSD